MELKKVIRSLSTAVGTLAITSSTVFGATDSGVNLSLSSGIFPTGSKRNFGNLFSFFIKILLTLGGILMLVFLILGGIRYITSGGDKAQAQAAREMITNALIGIIIIASSYAIATLLGSLFGIDVFNANISVPVAG